MVLITISLTHLFQGPIAGIKYWVGQKARSGFSVTSYQKTQMSLFTNPKECPNYFIGVAIYWCLIGASIRDWYLIREALKFMHNFVFSFQTNVAYT